MALRFCIPGPLQSLANGQSRIEVEATASTLQEALSVLFTLYPGIRDRIVTEQGAIREHVNVFVNDREARTTGGLATPVGKDAEIWIIPAISGG
jgi:molybdopterin converting factor small subunit